MSSSCRGNKRAKLRRQTQTHKYRPEEKSPTFHEVSSSFPFFEMVLIVRLLSCLM
ncbi:unnamed protein product [Amoebophrya sp. A25]|nr:unnamed protein product [Amoebophrya sp. A25]|eukprot:GSA25T00025252001.1